MPTFRCHTLAFSPVYKMVLFLFFVLSDFSYYTSCWHLHQWITLIMGFIYTLPSILQSCINRTFIFNVTPLILHQIQTLFHCTLYRTLKIV